MKAAFSLLVIVAACGSCNRANDDIAQPPPVVRRPSRWHRAGDRVVYDNQSFELLAVPDKALEETIHSRGTFLKIRDLVVFQGRLYWGYGDSTNNLGPIEIHSYDLAGHTIRNHGIVPQHSVDRFRIIDNQLWIPGSDSTETSPMGSGYELNGSVYRLNNNLNFTEFREIPRVLHLLDIARFRNHFFCGGGTADRFDNMTARVYATDQPDKPWSEAFDLDSRSKTDGIPRTCLLQPYQGKLYAFYYVFRKSLRTGKQPDPMGNTHDCYAYDGVQWLKQDIIKPGQIYDVANSCIFQDKMVIHSHHADGDKAVYSQITVFDGDHGNSLLVDRLGIHDVYSNGNTLFALVAGKEQYVTATNSLDKPMQLVCKLPIQKRFRSICADDQNVFLGSFDGRIYRFARQSARLRN